MRSTKLSFLFFKQKTAYELEYGLVGSEMCIRDSHQPAAARPQLGVEGAQAAQQKGGARRAALGPL